MSILSDSRLRELISEGQLVIEGGDENRIWGGSFQIRPGRVIPTGRGQPVDFPADSEGAPSYRIHPGEMVWIRTAERVRMPPDLCAFFWQTHSLSRKGLQLINQSMVPPGYEGNLACLFVNFGRSSIPIFQATRIAKLVFMPVEGAPDPEGPRSPGEDAGGTDHPYSGRSTRPLRTEEYDERVESDALQAPDTFLDLGLLESRVVDGVRTRVGEEVELSEKRIQTAVAIQAAKLDGARVEADRALTRTLAETQQQMTQVADQQLERVSKGFWPAIRERVPREVPLAAMLLTLGWAGIVSLKLWGLDIESRVDAQVQSKLAEQLVLPSRFELPSEEPAWAAELREELRRMAQEPPAPPETPDDQ